MSGSSKRRILTTDSSPGSSNSLMEGSKRNNLENVLAGIDNFHDETGFVADPSSKDDLDDVELDLDDCSTYGLGDQLYGESRDTKLLAKNIYCKVDVPAKALASATNLNSLVRRLLPGVFIPSKVLDCTVTGQSWRAGGAEVAAIQKTPLHPVALQAILDFAFAVAKKKHWSATRRLAKLKPVITRRLIEMKNQFRKGTLRD
ncbi:uncharacterized protein LOC113210702 [Frankliniella occidentalis]|uniref:Uncharacterized protein LOC113210702 n=1 Tax=Frankliniella occidentalis TaxID=133901 RepID=A0A6J1T1K2_FRAOC|nr:uncharacterized protein LOC113210702 [Frankliniella occidentalis]